jgi:hypothetical protein
MCTQRASEIHSYGTDAQIFGWLKLTRVIEYTKSFEYPDILRACDRLCFLNVKLHKLNRFVKMYLIAKLASHHHTPSLAQLSDANP